MTNFSILNEAGKRVSFIELFTELKLRVEIPIIQRDYAQGRETESEVRITFLNALHQYLEENKPNRDLDFVYGSLIEDESDTVRFVPLDGQQRLTTLFLLHWYLGQLSGQSEYLREKLSENEKSLFSYETRTSSRDFCDALINKDIDLSSLLESDPGKNNSLSKTIRDSGWFYLSWMSDPTIQSMLIMLDAIHFKFSNAPDFFQRLVDEDKPVITFLFLNLKKFNLTDDLYIKMNARGKPLTQFENFKAKFEQRIKSFKTQQWPCYALEFSQSPVNGYDYFIHRIDNAWADLFWAYRNVSSNDNTFDDELMNFIRLIISSQHILNENIQSELLFGTGGKLKELSFLEYDELGCFSQSMVIHLIGMLDLLYHDGIKNNKISPYLIGDEYYSENDVFEKVIQNQTSYPEKLRFNAFYMYLMYKEDRTGLFDWLRVIYNLTENSIVNDFKEYRNALISIRNMLKNEPPILEQLKNDYNISGFLGSQILEEKVKSHLLDKSEEWKFSILKAEKHPFFRGQIGFALKFSKILEFYNEHKSCNWDSSLDQQYLENFQKYIKAGCSVFSKINGRSKSIDYLWEKAVLSKGQYFTKTSADRWNMLSSESKKGNIERDHSWRRLLRIPVPPSKEWDTRQSYVKAIFDDVKFNVNDIQKSLSLICDEAINDSQIDNWRKAFIQHSELFDRCNQGYIVKNEEEIVLLHESQRNHYHSELFTKVLEIEFKSQITDFIPFKEVNYWPVKSGGEYPFVYLSSFVHGGREYEVDIYYVSDEFELCFYACDEKDCNKQIIGTLELHEFEFQSPVGEATYFSYKCSTKGQVFEKMRKLCNDLNELSSED